MREQEGAFGGENFEVSSVPPYLVKLRKKGARPAYVLVNLVFTDKRRFFFTPFSSPIV